ncbi:DNA polymerase sigma, partial [Tetrabaena socialis]
ALRAVRQATQSAFPERGGQVQVEPFGSYIAGLGTGESDIDVVLVGLAEPSSSLGFYSRDERPRVSRMLDRLIPHLRYSMRLTKLIPIRHSRVPIIKLSTDEGVCVDISISGMSGPRAAEYIRKQVALFPALRPLVLVLKSFMKAEGLGEVVNGGLSSYGLTFMTIAHLM